MRQLALLTKNFKYNSLIVSKNYLTPQEMNIFQPWLKHGIVTGANYTPAFTLQLIENELYASLCWINNLPLIEKFSGKERTIYAICPR